MTSQWTQVERWQLVEDVGRRRYLAVVEKVDGEWGWSIASGAHYHFEKAVTKAVAFANCETALQKLQARFTEGRA